MLDVNRQMLCATEILMDTQKVYFKEKLSNHGQLNIEVHMEGFDINVTNKQRCETNYL
jgi:hypothetical protein